MQIPHNAPLGGGGKTYHMVFALSLNETCLILLGRPLRPYGGSVQTTGLAVQVCSCMSEFVFVTKILYNSVV